MQDSCYCFIPHKKFFDTWRQCPFMNLCFNHLCLKCQMQLLIFVKKLMFYFQCYNHQCFILHFPLPKLLCNKLFWFHHFLLFCKKLALRCIYTHLQCYHMCLQFYFMIIPLLFHHKFSGFGSFQFQCVP